jgi:SAM-dependent methyltransferase
LAPAAWPVDRWLAEQKPGSDASVLDVGCGAGAALDTYRAAGWDTWGVEPDPDAGAVGRRRGHHILTGDFGTVEIPSVRFGLVRFRHSLEHLADPVAALARGVNSLAPGGMCLVELPNPSGWLALAAKKSWWQLDAPRHVTLPQPHALERAFASLGCATVLRQTYSYGSGFAATAIFWAQSRGSRGWGQDWRLRADWKPTGYAALRLLGLAVSAVADLARRGDSFRILTRKADAGQGES